MNLKIGICEDMEAQQRNLRRMLDEWAESRGRRIDVRLYGHSSAFWFDWCGSMDLDVLLLDIDLGEGQLNGMDLAKKIREKDSRIAIVFITAMAEYMSQGYDVGALHFLVKPVERARLWEIMDRACAAVPADRQNERLLLTEETGVSLVPTGEIVYAEAFSHSVTLHLSAKDREARGQGRREIDVRSLGMKELEERLPAGDFYRCHRSYLVHLNHVDRLEKCRVFMDDGSCLPVSRRREKELFRVFVDYYKERPGR